MKATQLIREETLGKNFRSGQINIEFLAAAGFYLLALGTVITIGSGLLPHYSQEADKASLNLEARSLTNQMLSEPGSHNYGGGGTDWERSQAALRNMESFGLASDFLEVERDKIENLSTAPVPGRLNYSYFKRITGVKNQYRFRFIWLPTVQTHESFTKGNPPSNPPIQEPDTDSYLQADNRIHYGSVNLEGEDYRFLVVAHNGVYNTSYISDDWDFEFKNPHGRHEELPIADFTIYSFQNRERTPGSLMVLNQTVKTFGANIDSDSTVVTMERFGVLEGEPLKIKVWAW